MACFLERGDDTRISIPNVEEQDKCTYYTICVEIGDIKWCVNHRFSDFVQLHDVLVAEHGVAKDLLPPKKILGNKEPSFIEKRRQGLEAYLSTIVRYLQNTMPNELVMFLNFDDYDITFLLQTLAVQFFQKGETMLMKSRNFTFTPLQLFAISERLKQPCPAMELRDQRQHFSHILDYCSQVIELLIQGSWKAVKKSNIIPNNLTYDLCSFKSIEKLIFMNINCKTISDLGCTRNTVKFLEVHQSEMTELSDILLCDQFHKTLTDNNKWINVVNADFSYNNINKIDESIQQLPNLEVLNLENNKLHELQFLNHLTKLKYLNLSANHFQTIENFELKIGKIVYLDLSQNHLISLKWFGKLFSLETLDVKSNQISDVAEVKHIIGLPCIENLILTGNPVSIIVDYRVKILELFGSRAVEICLDNEKSNQKELDKVAVLQAIRIAKEGRVPCKITS